MKIEIQIFEKLENFGLSSALDIHQVNHTYKDFVHFPRKFKGGLCCGGHFAVTYGGELLYLRIFS